MICQKFNEEWVELLVAPVCDPTSFDPILSLPVKARTHIQQCDDCRRDFAEWHWLTEQVMQMARPAPSKQFADNVVLALKLPEAPASQTAAKYFETTNAEPKKVGIKFGSWIALATPIAAAILLTIAVGPFGKQKDAGNELAANDKNKILDAELIQARLEQASLNLSDRAAYLVSAMKSKEPGTEANELSGEIAQELAALPLTESATDTAASLLQATKRAAKPVKELGASAVNAFQFLRVDLAKSQQGPST